MAYETDEEQVEALKKWWKENGKSIFFGIVIGFALLGGWRWWQIYTEQQGLLASSMYEKVLFALEKEDVLEARQLAGHLLSQHSNSPYAILAALNLAHKDLEEGEIDSSHARLQWVIENSQLPELAHIARLRKAKIFLSQDKVAETNTLITGIDQGTFVGGYAEIKGDIALAQGKIEDARQAYTEAVPLLSPQHGDWVQMKLDNLGLIEEERIEANVPKFEITEEESVISVETIEPEAATLFKLTEPEAPTLLEIIEPEATEPEVTPITDPEAPTLLEIIEPEATEPEVTPITEPEAAPVLEPEVTPITEPEAAPVLEPEVTPITEPEAAPVLEPEVTPITEPEAAPVLEPEVTPITEPEATPVLEPEVTPISTETPAQQE